MAEQILIKLVSDASQLESMARALQKTGQFTEQQIAAVNKMYAASTQSMTKLVSGNKTAIKSLGDVERVQRSLLRLLKTKLAPASRMH
jgi:hypothetical protein